MSFPRASFSLVLALGIGAIVTHPARAQHDSVGGLSTTLALAGSTDSVRPATAATPPAILTPSTVVDSIVAHKVQASTKPAPLIVAGQAVSIVFEQTEQGTQAFPAVALNTVAYLGDKLRVRLPDGREYKARAASKTVVHLILPQ